MNLIDITEKNKKEYNSVVTHPLQSYEWGEFRKKTGLKIIRKGIESNGKIIDGFTLTIHKIPKTPWNIGYLPKGNKPTKELLQELKEIGKQEKCIFIQLEPNIERGHGQSSVISHQSLMPSHRPLFTKYTFVLDLTKTEEEILSNFHSKTRYNIRLAERKGVEVTEDNSDKAFKKYLELTEETTKRQHFYAHTRSYHQNMWETLKDQKSNTKNQNFLTTHLLVAEHEKHTLTSWILFAFKDTLYYPYGASTTKYKSLMSSNLIMWEAIKFGKKMGLKKFDLWGALGPDASEKDPWYGFHKFKMGYNPRHVEFVGSYDLVINKPIYQLYKITDKLRWGYLKLRSKFS